MPDFLEDGVDWLAAVFKAEVSQSVTYRRGSSSVTGLKASVGNSDQVFVGPRGGVSIQRDDLDFVITGADLIISSAAAEPQVGDTIDYNGDRYVVAKPDDGTPCFFWDVYGVTMTIHTKFKAAL